MGKVGVGNEPLYERVIFGLDGANYRVIKCNSDGELVVAVAAGEAGAVYPYGYVNAAWQKQPMPFGYSNKYAEAISDTNLDTGTNLVRGAIVAAGKVIVITNVAISYIGTSPSKILALLDDGTDYTLYAIMSPTSAVWYDKQGYWVMNEGTRFTVKVNGATAADDLLAQFTGFQMDIAL